MAIYGKATKYNRQNVPTPCFLVYEEKVRGNLSLIDRVKKEAGIDVILAFKAFSLWRLFPIFKEYGFGFTASSLNELLLGNEFLGKKAHTYCVAYTEKTFPTFLGGSSHITFNTLSQWEKFAAALSHWNKNHSEGPVSAGLRVNTRCSVIETDIYNPALPGSRFGVSREEIDRLPKGIEGLHFHQLCESNSHDLEKVLNAFEEQFGEFLGSLKWVNMGGGHLMTHKDYDTEHLISLLRDFKQRHPGLQIILEPGSAFTWQTGDLITTVVDTVENSGVKTAIIDASFACHMPDTLEMPYLPKIKESVEENISEAKKWRLGGNSCLSGDFKGDWFFTVDPKSGDRLTLRDMNHYTTVKTHMFNGLQHPSIAIECTDGSIEMLREFTYEDYKNRMS